MKYIDSEKLYKKVDELMAYYAKVEKDMEDDAELSLFYQGKRWMCSEVISLITSLQQERSNNMIQWTGNNLKEVIDFTGKSPRFGEWFNSWEEYENYVHTHNDILKLFCEDGSHYEVPAGAWIVKTPDGYNLPSVAKYIPQEQPTEGKQVIIITETDGDANIHWDCRSLDDVEALLASAQSFITDKQVEKLRGPGSGPDYNTTEGRFRNAHKFRQEQPEVDLEKELKEHIDDEWRDEWSGDVGNWIRRSGGTTSMEVEDVKEIARHFYELGLNARKEE